MIVIRLDRVLHPGTDFGSAAMGSALVVNDGGFEKAGQGAREIARIPALEIGLDRPSHLGGHGISSFVSGCERAARLLDAEDGDTLKK